MKFILILFFVITINVYSQKIQEEYIEKYNHLAVKEMKRAGIPASITLAQAIIESSSGTSYLAKEGNNHFGIKCHKDWKGEKIYADDDTRNECFRKYSSVEDSYKDHSDFLRSNSRYYFLFDFEITDYKAWCNGLKKAGYATNPQYDEILIALIEKHKLYEYDTGNSKPIKENQYDKKEVRKENIHKVNRVNEISPYANEILENNGVPYIIVKEDISVYDVASQIDLMAWQVAKYNDLSKKDTIKSGEYVYLKPKRNKAEPGNNYYKTSGNENLWQISQKYAVKLKKLKKYNLIEDEREILPENTLIKLR